MACASGLKAIPVAKCILSLLLLHILPSTLSHKYEFLVQMETPVAKLDHFWKSTGFCPTFPHQNSSGYFLGESELQNLILIGSVPQNGIRQVRIHWLLDLAKLSVDNRGGKLSLDFSLLDQLVDRLWRNNLRPGFELMGNPSDWFTDFENAGQVLAWRNMVTELAQRYVDKYGLDYVSEWNFESWNEPDHKDFDNLNFTLQGFLNYYDACSEGLRAVSPKLRLGGPGASCRSENFSVICWGLLQHCDNGTNYFTGETGVRIDFISFHKKGKGHSMYILETEIPTIQEIRERFPRLANVPIYNDEADPLVGWSKPQDWRADATYAAVVVKVIAQHQDLLIRPYPEFLYELLSNDNGFLNFNPSFFSQRTLVARFQMNKTHPPSLQTVKKPVLSVMGLLALLGDTQVQVLAESGREVQNKDSDVGIIASVHSPSKTSGKQDSWQGGIILYNSNDTSNLTGTDNVRVTVAQLSAYKDMKYVVYIVNNTHGNPHAVWKGFDKPVYPTQEQFSEMRKQQEPIRIIGPTSLTGPEVTLDLTLSKPGVMFLQLCTKPSVKPAQVADLRLHLITPQDVLLSWDDVSSRCLRTYQVEYATTEGGKYILVNTMDITFTAFQHSLSLESQKKWASLDVSIHGWYRVRAVDFWNQPGAYSEPVQLK